MLIDEKTQEISLAVIKISVYARRSEFRRRMENLSLQILEDVASRDFAGLSRTTAVLENMLKFGKTIYEVEPVNSEMLLKELDSLNTAIRQFAEFRLPNSDIPANSLFDVITKKAKKSKSVKYESEKSDIAEFESVVSNQAILNEDQANPEKEGNSAIRQAAMIDQIRQFGNKQVQLKDIIAAFQDVSERTIRYDIQRLCNQGVLERIGSGGPGTYYKLRAI